MRYRSRTRADHIATKERRADRTARAWRNTARLPPGGVNDPTGQRLMGTPAGRTSPRDVPKRLDPFRPERNRGHRHRPGRRGHHYSSPRFGRGIGFSRITVGISTTHHNAGPKVLGGDRIGGGGSKHPFTLARSADKSAVEQPPPTESVKTVKTIKSVKTVKTIKTVKTVQSATLPAGDPITGSRAVARPAHRRITSFLPRAAGLPHGALSALRKPWDHQARPRWRRRALPDGARAREGLARPSARTRA
jgi:hypothetical protein